MTTYVCTNNPNHKFANMTVDGFCPEPTCFGVGFLVEEQNTPIGISGQAKEIGLCVLLMDVSGSMKATAFPNSPAQKDLLVAGSASGGIFDLAPMTSKDDAYIIGVIFDHNTNVIFTDSVSNILGQYPNASDFSKFLISKFTYGGTDINKVLNFAKQIYDDFLQKGDLSRYGGPTNVKPVKQTILTKNGDTKIVPNIRVLIYTDGRDEVLEKITGNPFAQEEIDVLMGAFFGEGQEEGCTALKSIVSKCPIHGVDQFFLINDPSRIQTLRKLFRMASGASGFCPVCLAQDRVV